MENRVLFIDDEPAILKSLRRLFSDEPYEILTSTSPTEALQMLRAQEIPVVVSDQRMPEMSGTDLLEKIKEAWPDTVRMVLTGHADLEVAMAAINKGNVYRFINKPWDDADLKLAIKNALTHYRLIAENKELLALTQQQNLLLMDFNQNLEEKVQRRTEEILSLLQRLESSFRQLIRVFIELMELFNPSLGGHAKRVNQICQKLIQHIGLEEEQSQRIEQAALLHDIGLIGLPRNLLEKKEGTLSKAELALIQQHPTLGHMILSKIDDLQRAAEIVRAHHENFDGSGFPDGLRGERIPFGGRVIRVANDYDNLIHQRQLSRIDALEYLRRKSGSDYDPQIVISLLHIYEQLTPTGAEETALLLDELQPGMVLSRDIRTNTGLFLLARNTKIEDLYLERLRNFHRICPIVDMIYVYRNSIASGHVRNAA